MSASKNDKTESKVEAAKRAGNRLRGTIKEVLASDAVEFGHDDLQLLKFHGTYQQDDRDTRKKRRAEGLGKEVIFMIRAAIPGGVMTADQYLGLDTFADTFANGTLRLTTRQGIQFHGVIKGNLKGVIAGINETLLTTLSACGDVGRNVMACPAPLQDEAHILLRKIAREVAVQLRPKTRAYHDIWLDGEKHLSTAPETEDFYGDLYLPRKFKTGIAIDCDNCIDVFNYDAGLIAIIKDGAVEGFNMVIGGGMGMTHRKPDTYAALAQQFIFISPEHAVEAVKTVAGIFRDHGNREDRKHARLKYLLAEWGMDRFREEFTKRAGFEFEAYRPLPRLPFHDHLGCHDQGGGKSFYGVNVENGRVGDFDVCKYKSAFREIVAKHRPGVCATAQQSLLFTDLEPGAIADVERILADHGVPTVDGLSNARRFSMACPALPTCGLALSESERVMPATIDDIEAELARLGLEKEPISIRMTGCPNGCARPYTAEIAFVGKGPENYQIFVGGNMSGDRVVDLFAADVKPADFVSRLRPLLQSWAKHRKPDEGIGDFYHRITGQSENRQRVTGGEEPNEEFVLLRLPS